MHPITRRIFVGQSATAVAALALPNAQGGDAVAAHQATGVRVGEMTDSTAVAWLRLTKAETRNNKGLVVPQKKGKKDEPFKLTVPVDDLEGACPPAAGRVRLRYGTKEDLSDAQATDWADVDEKGDGIHKFALKGLTPWTLYHYASEVFGHGSLRGTFKTAPAPSDPKPVRFCVMTCQGYPDRGHPDGHPIYPAMLALKPDFACLTGDLVYYDNDEPRAVTPRLARLHWERMFSLPRLREFTRQVGCYWLKDDHDTLKNDSWTGQKQGELTFAEGQAIFQQQSPTGPGPAYRTFRWGRDLQIWFTEGRDHRSPNTMADGPTKTIWGAEQKAWFKKTVKESDATWKVLVSPTPLVGPDRATGKNDNHSNAGFKHEGDEIRGWLKENVPDNFFVVCGDRHWQYHSKHPQTGLNEFSVGPASNQHAGGTPGEDKAIHQFHRVQGGFLSVEVARDGGGPKITLRLHDVTGKVAYEWAPGGEGRK